METISEFIRQNLEEASSLELLLLVILIVACIYMFIDIIRPRPQLVLTDLSKPKAPIVLRDFTLSQLKEFKGVNGQPIYISARGKVYDVSSRTQFYGPGGPYGVFSGHDASKCLAKMSVNPEDLNQPIEDLNSGEIETLNDWIAKFETQYDCVGSLIDAPSISKKNV